MTAILVTGGAGFIGSNFIPYFVQKHSHYKIINLDLLTYAGDLKNLKEVEKLQSRNKIYTKAFSSKSTLWDKIKKSLHRH